MIPNYSRAFVSLAFEYCNAHFEKDDEFVKFHAKQGTVIFIASIILWFIPIIGWLMQIAVLLALLSDFESL